MIPHCLPEQASAAVDAGEALVLDVREPDEWARGHIAGALHVPLQTLPARLEELPRDRLIVCQCASGGRSASAARFLVQSGFQATNLVGGIMQWQRSGLPVVR